MKTDDVLKYFAEAIKLELNVAELYLLFSQTFPEDRQFWWKLSWEENNHASLIESEKMFYKVNAFPDELFSVDIEELVKINDSFILIMEHFKSNPIKETAFKIALELENSAIELHYQMLAESTTNSRAINLFKELNGLDKDHAKRIKELASFYFLR